MLRSLSIASTGGRELMSHIDTISNNIANVNTVAYKKTRANFADLFYQQVQRAGVGEAGKNQFPTGLFFGTGVHLVSTEKMFTPGQLERTDRPLDMAIDGDGFFQVKLPDGTTAYTRAGNFNRDSEGNLVTAQGYIVQPPITIPQNLVDIQVDETGNVFGRDPTKPETLTPIGSLTISRFTNPSGLEAIGDNLFKETPASGIAILGTPSIDPGFGKIRQGFLELSNVEVVEELVDLITAQRAFETNSRVIQAADDILQTIAGLRR